MNNLIGSPHDVFTIIKGIESVMNTDKFTMEYRSQEFIYNRQPEFIKNICKRIFNEIENNFYSYKVLTYSIYYIYYNSKQNKKTKKYKNTLQWKEYNYKNINIINNALSNNRFLQDKKLLIKLNETFKFKTVQDFLKINNGVNLIYELIEDKIISPITYINLIDEMEVEIAFKTNEFKRFEKISVFLKLQITN